MPRHMEVALCVIGLLVLSPLLLLIAVGLRVACPGPVFFRQRRVGQHGRTFELIKFRSMVHGEPNRAPLVTASCDARITPLGRILRRTKLDELPQLWNVVRGDMSLVGPRPEVCRYVEHYPELFDLVLRQRPGITDICTVQLRNEEQILAQVDHPERYYIDKLLPRKLSASIREGWRRTFWRDTRVLLATVLPGLGRLAPLPDFRPLADLYHLPVAPRLEAVGEAGAAVSSEPAVAAPAAVEVGT